MNFKQWLLSEELKSANATNPSLTTIIPPLNKGQEKDKKPSSENFKELAYYFGRNGSGPSAYDSNKEIKSLARWINYKQSKINPNEATDKKTWDNIVKFSKTWDKEKFPYELPLVWRDVKSNKKQDLYQKYKKNSSENFKELAYYFGRNGSGPPLINFDEKIQYLGRWHAKKKNRIIITYGSDDKTWADMVKLSKTPKWIDPDTGERFKFFPLPKNWRKIEPSSIKSLGEKLVANILEKLGIKNDPQHRDKACVSKRCLPFDFSIEHNGKKYLLEYHGEQHYVPTYFGSKEGMTDQVKANHALEKFKYTQKNDAIKYNHCVKRNLPLIVIPYWLDKGSDIVKNIIIEFLKTNQFNETFANPVVPQNYKEHHARMLKMTKCFASGKANCKELFKKQKTTFEQFLIGKNFTYFNA